MAKEIDIAELKQMLQQGADLVDVREDDEVGTGKMNNTKHWPLSSFGIRQGEISSSRPTIFYCQSGLRSLKAAEIATGWTQQDVYSLKGGYLALKDEPEENPRLN